MRPVIEDTAARTGINDAMIGTLVRTFYARVRLDPLIGPVFESKVTDWDEHIERLCSFWSSVALMSGRYQGQPMAAHLPLPIDTPHFDRWLEIFTATAREVCPPAAAAHFSDRAARIADSLELGIAAQKGEIRSKRARSAKPIPSAAERLDDAPGDAPGFASPACSMHEVSDDYMGYIGKDELTTVLNELLEAERAGARVTLESARAAGSGPLAELMKAIQRDEARWCAMLLRQIKALGETPSSKTGAFHAKAMAIPDLRERIAFLNRGQAWVVRKLRDILPRVRDGDLHAALSEMLQSHEANI
jgi:truncated hemoglobin YjbI